MGLSWKFNLSISAALAVGFAIAVIVLQPLANRSARAQVLETARLMLAGANAVRHYTSTEIQPVTPLEKGGKFVPQTVPSYAAQTNFKAIRAAFPGYTYREVALNPTNLADRAEPWEADIINQFRNDAASKELILDRETPTGASVYLTRPLAVGEPACLACHSAPSAAPAAMTNSYGMANGFGWKLNEVIGAQVLSVPAGVSQKLAHSIYMTSLYVLIGIFAVVMIVLNVLLYTLIIKPVRKVSRMADAVSLGQTHFEPYIKPGKDEISSLSVSFDRMRRSLDSAMEMINA